MRGIGPRFATARRLPHMRQYQALRCHDQSVMRVEAVEGEPIAARQCYDIGADAAQGIQYGIIFAPRFGEVGS